MQKRVNEAAAVFDRKADPQGNRVSDCLFALRDVIIREGVMVEELDWSPVVELSSKIRESGEELPFGFVRDGELHVYRGWEGAHFLMCAVLQYLLRQHPDFTRGFVKDHGGKILAFARYAIGYATKCASLASAGGGEGPDDPAGRRGQTAYLRIVRASVTDVLKMLILDDFDSGAGLGGEVAASAKSLFARILREEDQSDAMFRFGQSAWALYSRDPDWTRRLLPAVFPVEAPKRHLYLAAWTGFLTRAPTREMFWEPEVQGLYWRGLGLDRKVDAPFRSHRNPDFDEGLAGHFALVFFRDEAFGPDHPMLRAFLDRGDPGQLAAFARVLGDLMSDRLRDRCAAVGDRLVWFWEWLLASHTEPEPFTELGMWMSLHHGMFDSVTIARLTKETLRKSGGKLRWKFGLESSVDRLAHDAPEDALEIADLFLHANTKDVRGRQVFASEEGGWLKAVDFLFENIDTRDSARARLGDVRSPASSASVPHAV